MPVNVEVLSGEPIVLLTITGMSNGDELLSMYRQVAAVADQWGGPVYAVYDASRMKMPWGTALSAMNAAVKKLPGSPTDERVATVFVGATDIVKTGAEALSKPMWGGLDIKVFGTVDEALGYAREQVRVASGG